MQEILFVGIICPFALIEMVMVYKILKVGFKEAFVLATPANLASYLVEYFFLT